MRLPHRGQRVDARKGFDIIGSCHGATGDITREACCSSLMGGQAARNWFIGLWSSLSIDMSCLMPVGGWRLTDGGLLMIDVCRFPYTTTTTTTLKDPLRSNSLRVLSDQVLFKIRSACKCPTILATQFPCLLFGSLFFFVVICLFVFVYVGSVFIRFG